MSFRSRLLVGFLLLALVPLAAFAFGVRREIAVRLSASFEERASGAATAIAADLAREDESIGRRLRELAAGAADDNRLRLAVVRSEPAERDYLLDYAGRAMRLAGLSALQLQDEEGRILSSGHFRNEFGRRDPELPGALAAVRVGPALAELRTPGGPRLALVRAEPVRLGGRRLALVGGEWVDESFVDRLAAGSGLEVALLHPAGALRSGAGAPGGAPARPASAAVRAIPIPFVGGGPDAEATLVVSHPLAPLRETRRGVDAWFILALGLTAGAALLLAAWLSARLGRPLTELARKTSRVDLDRLDADFSTDRRDEIGALSRLLASMSERLRASAGRLREVERRATLGEIARQVNHDIKNGLVPLRNVFRHLLEVAERDPTRLASTFRERSGTIESGIGYLEGLAANYARLTPRLDLRACDPNVVAREVAAACGGPGVTVRLDLMETAPAVRADPLALRRILENLTANALEAVRDRGGEVTLSTRAADGGERVLLAVSDDGPGLAPEELRRIFEDFYTTKPAGTGLGLTVVRRLVSDVGGTLRAESRPGEGSRFVVELEAARGDGGPGAGERRSGR